MFRFTIRDALWLLVVVGLRVCWWLDHLTTTVDVFPHELSQLGKAGERVKVTIVRGVYDPWSTSVVKCKVFGRKLNA